MTVVVRPSDRSPLRCPYCLDGLGERIVRGPTCATPVHPDCRVEAGRCTTFCCAGRRPTALRPPLPLPWLGDGALRGLVDHLLAVPAFLGALLVCGIAAAAVHPVTVPAALVPAVLLAVRVGGATVTWFRAEGGP